MTRARTSLVMIGMATFLATGTAVAQQGNPGIAPINSRINTVKTYADLGAEWWQWALQAPFADNPLFDATGEKCRVGQQGPVWFLAGTTKTDPIVRQCEVPVDKAIFFPIINNVYLSFLSDPPETRTAEYVRWAVEFWCDRNSIRDLSVMIDGVPVARPERFVTTGEQSPLFQAQLPTDNLFEAVGTPPDPSDPNPPLYVQDLVLSPGAHMGYYLYLKPLPPGPHTIEWTATWDCLSQGGPFSQNIRYDLDVLPGVTGQVQ